MSDVHRCWLRSATRCSFTVWVTRRSTCGCRSISTSSQDPARSSIGCKGTLLTDYRRRLTEGEYEAFLARYAEVLTAELPDEHPFPFPFKRILLWGRRG